jgi:hypothetical protein
MFPQFWGTFPIFIELIPSNWCNYIFYKIIIIKRTKQLYILKTREFKQKSCAEAEFLDEIQKKSPRFSSLLFTVTSTDLPWDFYFFKLTQRTVSRVHLRYTVKRNYRKSLIENYTPFPMVGLRNPHRNPKSENSQDYAQKPQRNYKFMNLASVVWVYECIRCQVKEGRQVKSGMRIRADRLVALFWDRDLAKSREEDTNETQIVHYTVQCHVKYRYVHFLFL